jgi:pSer/pThr/pTyr-binding forkhead associated (FHA) protein
MGIILEIIQGPRKGARLKVRAGLTVGRKAADIVIEDPKISSRHAHIEDGPNGELILIDDQSSNGIRLRGRRVPRLALRHGTEFQLGESILTVIDDSASKETAPRTAPPRPPPAPPAIAAPKPSAGWKKRLIDWLSEHQTEIEDQPLPVTAFRTGLQLEFVRGCQHSTIWEIGYGPRKVGAQSAEFPIFEPEAPDVCFELVPSRQGVIFRTNFSDKVHLNDKEVSQAFLKDGDVIAILHSHIQVGFRK